MCRNRFFFVLKLSDVNNWYAKQPPLKFQATPISRRKIFRRSLNRWNIEQQIIKHHSILNIDIAPCRLRLKLRWGDCRVMSRSEMELLNKKISYVIIIITISKKRLKPSKLCLSGGRSGSRRGSKQSKSIHLNGYRFMDTTRGLIKHGKYFTLRSTIEIKVAGCRFRTVLSSGRVFK